MTTLPDTLPALSEALRSRRLTSVAVTEHYLARCAALEEAVGSFLTIDRDGALAAARAADARLDAGRDVTPITGIPLGVKDIIDVAGLRGTGHSPLYASRIPDRDAFVIARLRAQGAVILGKTATNEFAIGAHGSDAIQPNPRNPWSARHATGGSSSGSGTAVAAGEVPGALGTDTGGSVRVPAAFNGITGLKTSRGLVSRSGVMPLSEGMDSVGPMARTTACVALLLDAMVAVDPAESAQRPADVPSYLEASATLPQSWRLDRMTGFDAGLAPEYRSRLDQVEALLLGLGATRFDSGFDGLEEMDAASALIATAESWHLHRERLAATPGLYGRDARVRLHIGALISADDYLLAKQRAAACSAQFAACLPGDDILMLPMNGGPAPANGPLDPATLGYGHWEHVGTNGWVNALGAPALSLPCGLVDGRPVAVQLVSVAGRDALLLAVARALETALSEAGLALPPLDAPRP